MTDVVTDAGRTAAPVTITPHAPAAPLPPSDALLTPEERAAWSALNDRGAPLPGGPGLAHRLAEAAARRPDEPAVQAVDGTWTHRELHAEADRIAGVLAGLGVAAGGTVAVAATRRRADYAALLAALKLGCAFLPVVPDGPARRLEAVLADAAAAALVADGPAAAALAAGGAALPAPVLVGAAADAPPGWSATGGAPGPAGAPGAGHPPADPGRTSYVIYTSGSTGIPKGVMTGEEALLNFCAWYAERHEVVPHDRLAQTAPLTFDPAVQQILPAWLAGACLVVVPEDVQRDAGEFLDWLATERVTHLDIVTPHWLQLLDAAARRGRVALPHLRWIVVGGETYFFHQTHHWHRVVDSPARLNTVYGPTEATVNATEFPVDAGVAEGQVPIGRPLPNYRAYVLDEQGALCPPYITGELHLAGTGVAQRYCSAEATERAFHRLTVGEGVSERLYRTGDLARLIEHGDQWVLEFQGRTDSQVKVSGYRIELEEVQAALAAVPGVTGCAVVLRTEPARQIVAGYASAGLAPEEVRAALAERLPEYMVPHLLVPVEAVPLTANGKADRDALLALAAEHGAGAAGGTPPRGPVETAVAAAWAEVLGVPRVDAEDDFFARGGSSLLAFRVVALLRDRGVTVRAADLLQARTVRALAERATVTAGPVTDRAPAPAASSPGPGQGTTTAAPPLPAPGHRLVEETGSPLALPPATELALLGGEADQGDHALLDLGLPPETDPEAVRRALAELIDRHALLRARLGATGGRPRLAPVTVTRFDLPVLEGAGPDTVDVVRPLLATRTGLRNRLPVTAALLRLPDRWRLLLAVRHLLVDGAALRRITAELAAALGLAAPPAPLEPLGDQLAGIAERARRMDPAPHLRAFVAAEREAQRRLTPRLAAHGTVAEVEVGDVPQPSGADPAGTREALLVASAALAAHRWLGLETVPVSVPRQGRAAGRAGDSADTVANMSDVAPLLVAAGGGADGTVGSAVREWEARTGTGTHWSAALLAHCPELAGRWPGRREAPLSSFLFAVEEAAEPGTGGTEVPGTDGAVIAYDSPTEASPGLCGAVQFTVVAGPGTTRLRLVGWDLPEPALRELAPLWRQALAEVSGTAGATGRPERSAAGRGGRA